VVQLIYPPTDAIFLVVGDVPVDSEGIMMTSSISRIYQRSLPEVLVRVVFRACIYRGGCAALVWEKKEP
jgi:hypothetical protein